MGSLPLDKDWIDPTRAQPSSHVMISLFQVRERVPLEGSLPSTWITSNIGDLKQCNFNRWPILCVDFNYVSAPFPSMSERPFHGVLLRSVYMVFARGSQLVELFGM